MIPQDRHDIDEVFMVRTESITLFAALVGETAGKFRAAGKVRFSDGSVTSFRHPAGDRAVMRRKIATMCEVVASFYGTEVFRRKIVEGPARIQMNRWEREDSNLLN
ncbi:MAG: hypothetical protein JRK53_03395 [Deltaproteobacteria bacterium]|nr:hypothetical protein [Deltaproteobacteria bacterium]MBW1816520.1 hypothetical protein [Deltaproteobacteria bacterium]MBW2285757.1 hypothetical protein [Deltaproteobacteria bacterium]